MTSDKQQTHEADTTTPLIFRAHLPPFLEAAHRFSEDDRSVFHSRNPTNCRFSFRTFSRWETVRCQATDRQSATSRTFMMWKTVRGHTWKEGALYRNSLPLYPTLPEHSASEAVRVFSKRPPLIKTRRRAALQFFDRLTCRQHASTRNSQKRCKRESSRYSCSHWKHTAWLYTCSNRNVDSWRPWQTLLEQCT